MNTKMRLSKQQLSEAETLDILEKGTSGVLSLLGPDGYPYGVPVSYLYLDGKLYFHGAKAGYKYQCIEHCDKACFTVIGMEQIVKEEYTTYYRSAVVFGKMSVIDDPAAMRNIIDALALKYVPDDSAQNRNAAIEKEWRGLGVYCMDIEEMTGKKSM